MLVFGAGAVYYAGMLFKGFDIPLQALSGEKFEQPILFGANNLSGIVQTNVAYAGGLVEGAVLTIVCCEAMPKTATAKHGQARQLSIYFHDWRHLRFLRKLPAKSVAASRKKLRGCCSVSLPASDWMCVCVVVGVPAGIFFLASTA